MLISDNYNSHPKKERSSSFHQVGGHENNGNHRYHAGNPSNNRYHASHNNNLGSNSHQEKSTCISSSASTHMNTITPRREFVYNNKYDRVNEDSEEDHDHHFHHHNHHSHHEHNSDDESENHGEKMYESNGINNSQNLTNNGNVHQEPNYWKTQKKNQQHHLQQLRMNSMNSLLMLIDGVGLAFIAAATIFEGYELWGDYFHLHYALNEVALTLWFAGRTCQVIGLLILIAHAASFQIMPVIERYGMLFLTIGPMINFTSFLLFRDYEDLLGLGSARITNSISGSLLTADVSRLQSVGLLLNRPWLATELTEVTGILLLDISLLEMEEHSILFFELVGFVVLCCASLFQYDFESGELAGAGQSAGLHLLESLSATTSTSSALPMELLTVIANGEGESAGAGRLPTSWWTLPTIGLRLDSIHCGETLGLLMLMVVAYGQYRLKLEKHEFHEKHHPEKHHPEKHLSEKHDHEMKRSSAMII